MFNPIHIDRRNPLYAPALCCYLGDHAPAVVTARGNVEILCNKTLALFCSIQCSGDVILQTYDLARALRDTGVTIISGFHSPMEKECLLLLLRGTQPVIVCPARSIDKMRLVADWKSALAQDRLLLLSPFEEKHRRVTTERAQTRNAFVAALADMICIAHATPGRKTERFCTDVIAWGKSVFTLESSENAGLIALGAKPIRLNQINTHVLSCFGKTGEKGT